MRLSQNRTNVPVPVLVVVDDGYVGQEAVRQELGPGYKVDIAKSASEALGLVPTLDGPIVIVPENLDGTSGHVLFGEIEALGYDFVGLLMVDNFVGVPRPVGQSGVSGFIVRPLEPGQLAFHVGAAASVRASRRAIVVRNEGLRRDLDTLREGLRHELRGQLQTVVGLASLILEIERPQRQTNDELLDWLGRIAAGGDRMTRLVDHLADWLTLTRRDLDLGVVNLADIVMEAIAEARVAFNKKSVRISTMPEDLGLIDARVRGDGRALAQAVRHLIDNALRCDPSDEPTIIISLQSPPPPMGGWVLSVKDQGPGLPETAFKRIFKLFERHQHDPSKPAGPGVGLAIVAKVAERHNGNAWIERNTDGPGLTVHLFVPSTQAF